MVALMLVNAIRHRGLLRAQPLDLSIHAFAPTLWSLLLGLVPPLTVESPTLRIGTDAQILVEALRR